MAWKAHGNVRDQSTEYGFFNPDLTAYPAIDTNNETLKQAKHYTCSLKVGDEKALPETLDKILENPVFIGYTYNSLLDRLKELKEQNPELYSWMITSLKKSEEMNTFLAEKLGERGVSVLKLALKDDSQNLHFFTARVAGERGEKGLPILKKTLKSNNKNVRAITLEALSKLGQKGLPLFKEALNSTSSEEEIIKIQNIIDEIEKQN